MVVQEEPKAAIHNLGCRVNQYEAEALEQMLKRAGYRIVDFNEAADLYIVNSCAVTLSAASKSRSLARQAKRRGGDEAVVIMAGCYSQVSPEEVEGVKEVDYIIAASDKDRLTKLLKEVAPEQTGGWLGARKEYREMTDYPDFHLDRVNQTTRANLKIQDGCNQFCSYCIIPLARGQLRSRPEASVLAESKRLLRSGVKEIVLTGIHLGAYGVDFSEDRDHLADLIEKMITLDGNFRIRLSSIEVGEVSDKLIDLIANSNKLCKHLHLPLQSGSVRILKDMNRPYTQAEYLAHIREIRKVIPEIAITTDIIVGFPGETRAEFEETLSVVEEAGFSRVHIFPYSPRPGTPAAEMADRVDGNVKKERYNELNELAEELAYAYRKDFFNQELQVLLEEDIDSGIIAGYSDNFIRIGIDYQPGLENTLIQAELLDISGEPPYKAEIRE
ncbi:MAG: tRNA (N(6)-L-threonylcarbamoyladenosine(37)-C(2))-methylthiotransferase MtaB [Bacillota bacterium]